MRKTKWKRCLAFITAFVLVMSNFGTVAAASAADSAAEESVVADEASVAEESAEDVSVPEEMTEAETAPEEITADQYVGASVSDMQDALKAAVLAELKKNDAAVTEENLETKLADYDDELVLADTTITSLKGLGVATQATKIDVGGCTGVTSIDEHSFQGCKFTEFVMPDGITSIGDYAFDQCSELTSVKTKSGADNTLLASLSEVGQFAFSKCSKLPAINILCSDISISMFADCVALADIEIGKQVETINATAFQNAGDTSGGIKVTIASGAALKTISNQAFEGAKFQENTTLDLSMCSKLNLIDNDAFYHAANLVMVKMPVSVDGNSMKLGDRAFGKGLDDSENPSTIIGKLVALGTDPSRTEGIVLPDYITSLGEGCFYGQTGIQKVTLPKQTSASTKKLEKIPAYLFDGCTGLKEISLTTDNAITEIGNCAFRCTGLTNTTFLEKMTKLETIGTQKIVADETKGSEKAKYGVYYRYEKDTERDDNTKNEEMMISSLPLGGVIDNSSYIIETYAAGIKYAGKEAGSEVFTGCPLKSITIPSSVKTIGARAFYNRAYEGNAPAVDLYRYPYIEPAATTLTWNSDADIERRVYMGAFQGNRALTEAKLPTGGSLVIEAYAFAADTQLAKINQNSDKTNILGNNITKIGRGAFFACMSLENIEIQAAEGKCPTLEPRIFERCSSLKSAKVPKAITAIPDGMFYAVPITTFMVGDGDYNSVASIGELAFMGSRFATLDLRKYNSLNKIEYGAFSYGNAIIGNTSAKNEHYRDEEKSVIFASSTGIVEPPSNFLPVMTKVQLPASLKGGSLKVGGTVFMYQESLTTIEKGDTENSDGFYIPDYLTPEEDSVGIFADTAVRKVKWEADQTATGRWTEIPQATFALCGNIKYVCDALPGTESGGTKNCDYLENIGMGAFWKSGIEEADLSGYSALLKISSGVSPVFMDGIEAVDGAFGFCPLKNVKLPTKTGGQDAPLVIGTRTFYSAYGKDKTTHEPIIASGYDLGRTTSIETKAFNCNRGIAEIVIPDAVTELKDSTFEACDKLVSVQFGKLTLIGMQAFKDCKALQFSEGNTLPETLVTIGASAFENDSALGSVYFGKNLTTIESSAFKNSGLTGSDSFKDAEQLSTIGNYAFAGSLITMADLTKTQIGTIEDSTFRGCTSLTEAKFNEGLQHVDSNALAGCTKLSKLVIYDHTTLEKTIFHDTVSDTVTASEEDGEGNVTVKELVTAQENSNYSITLEIKTSNDNVTVPTGSQIKLPYYVFKSNASDEQTGFSYVQIGNGSVPSDGTNLKVAVLSDYYKNAKEAGNLISNRQYYDKKRISETHPDNAVITDVEMIGLTGMNGTGDKTVPFTVVANPQYFTLAKTGVKLNFPNIATTYNVTVKEVPFHAVIHPQEPAAAPLPEGAQTYQAVSTDNLKMFYYDIVRTTPEEDGIVPDNYDLVIETTNPSVVYPALEPTGTIDQLLDVNEENQNKGIIREAASSEIATHYYYLAFIGTGSATVSVYPSGHYEWKRDFIYTVSSDLQTISLSLPSTYTDANGASHGMTASTMFTRGDSFNVFEKCSNWFNQETTAATGADYEKCSNRKLEFYVSQADAPYVSVTQDGKVTIKSNDMFDKVVSICARASKQSATEYTEATPLSIVIAAGTPDTIPGNQAVIYRDSERKSIIAEGTSETINMNNAEIMPVEIFFSITNAEGLMGDYYDCCDVTVTTSDPSVLYPAESISGTEAASYTTTQGGEQYGKPSIGGQRFTLVARKNGTAAITVYPKNYPTKAKTYTFVVQGSSIIDAQVNVQVKDAVTGATVQITKVSETDMEGEVMYVAPNEGETNIVIPDTVDINKIKYKVTAVPAGTFKDNKAVQSVTIGAYVTSIGSETFSGCTELTSVVIPDAVETIDSKAFYNCKKLTGITISPESKLKTIGNSAFQSCAALQTITIPDTVTKIGAKAFAGCKKLTGVTFGAKSKLTQIGDNAFQNCTSLTSIVIPAKVTKIGKAAFSGCKKLIDITVKSTKVKSVGKNAFKKIHKKAVIKVPKKKYSKYKKLFKKGQKKSVKIVK